jgi:hypothetical protein
MSVGHSSPVLARKPLAHSIAGDSIVSGFGLLPLPDAGRRHEKQEVGLGVAQS